MMVLIDSNEQATNPTMVARLREYFANPKIKGKLGEVTIGVSKLTCGDLNIITESGKTVAIERKEANDLLGSIGDGRVFKQVERMAKHANCSAIIVTGSIMYDKDDNVLVDGQLTNWRGSAVRAAMTAIMWSACPVLRSTPEAFPMTVMETVALADKPSEHFQKKAERVVTFPPLDESVEILSFFPGVGPKRAKAMMEFVGTGKKLGRLGDALMWATMLDGIKDESKPEGWGRLTISSVRNALGLNENEFISVVSYDESRGEHGTQKATTGKKAK